MSAQILSNFIIYEKLCTNFCSKTGLPYKNFPCFLSLSASSMLRSSAHSASSIRAAGAGAAEIVQGGHGIYHSLLQFLFAIIIQFLCLPVNFPSSFSKFEFAILELITKPLPYWPPVAADQLS